MRNILISGSSKGLGKELLRCLSNNNNQIYSMGNESSTEVDIRVDLRNFEATNLAIKKFFEDKDPISILICNAGSGRPPENRLRKRQLRKHYLELNVKTTENLIRASRPFFMKHKTSVVAISSIAAITNIKGANPEYGSSKRELNNLVRKLALEDAEHGIRYNLISPGNIYFEGSRWSEIATQDPQFVKNLLEHKVPLRKFISPEEIADAIEFLSSSAAKNITGLNLVIDGGQAL
jgi:NAD(P)-dependent dehydrogenase (short-subunit alcohol dehydrogenase family)